jgi:hypothetical protein
MVTKQASQQTSKQKNNNQEKDQHNVFRGHHQTRAGRILCKSPNVPKRGKLVTLTRSSSGLSFARTNLRLMGSKNETIRMARYNKEIQEWSLGWANKSHLNRMFSSIPSNGVR